MKGIIENQIGQRLSFVKRLLLAVTGLPLLVITVAFGIINASPGMAYSSASDMNNIDADAYISRGVSYLKKGQIEKSVLDFDRAINLDPGKAVAYVARGSAYYRLNQLDKAITDYNKAIEINPDLAVVYQDRGSIYQSQGRFDNAISDYSRALELNPENSAAYNFRGTAYFTQEQHQKAFLDFNRAIELDSGNVDAYIYRGYYYQAMEKYSKAVADYNRALELNPEIAVAKRLQNEIAQLSVEVESKIGEEGNDKEIECRWTLPMGSNIKRQSCLPKEVWARTNNIYRFLREGTYFKMKYEEE